MTLENRQTLTPGKVYKHVRCLDLHVLITGVPRIVSCDLLEARAWFLSPTGYMYWDEPVTIRVKSSELPNWKVVA